MSLLFTCISRSLLRVGRFDWAALPFRCFGTSPTRPASTIITSTTIEQITIICHRKANPISFRRGSPVQYIPFNGKCSHCSIRSQLLATLKDINLLFGCNHAYEPAKTPAGHFPMKKDSSGSVSRMIPTPFSLNLIEQLIIQPSLNLRHCCERHFSTESL